MRKYSLRTLMLLIVLLLIQSVKETPRTLSSAQSDKYYTFDKNSIILNRYEPTLTQNQRNEYVYWVGLRNSFYYSPEDDILEKNAKYFLPEDPDYYTRIYYFGYPSFALAIIMGAVILGYLVWRFFCKFFYGPKKVEENYPLITWIAIGISCTICLVFYILSYYNSVKVHWYANSITDFSTSNSIAGISYISKEISEKEPLLIITNTTNLQSVEVPNIKSILAEQKILEEKQMNFTNRVQHLSKSTFVWDSLFISIYPIITVWTILSYWTRKALFTWIGSFSLLISIIPALIILGLKCSHILLSIDFCQTINNSITSGVTPMNSLGLGMYLSCPSKTSMKEINSAIYGMSLSFSLTMDDLNATLYAEKNKIFNYTRNDTEFTLAADLMKDSENFVKGINYLRATNTILADLLSMKSCQFAQDQINYIEDHACYEGIDNMAYDILFMTIGIIGLLCQAVWMNKLIVVMRKVFAQTFKGERHWDVLDERDKDD